MDPKIPWSLLVGNPKKKPQALNHVVEARQTIYTRVLTNARALEHAGKAIRVYNFNPFTTP